MATETDAFLHLSRPLGPATIGAQPTTTPLTVNVQPQALFSILDHSLRRNKDQDRVIGTLLGTRSDDGTVVSIENCYAVPHTETQEQVEVDMDYQKTMLSLHLRANPREVLVGWYATSNELNTFSALIQNFYGQQGDGTWPHPAVHLTVSTEAGQPPEARTYISAPIGVTAERAADSCSFIPVPHEVKYGDAERSGLELINKAKEREDRTAGVVSDIESLERNVEYVLEMLDRVRNYVSDVLDEEERPSPALGQFLLNALSLAPRVEPADIERDLYVITPLTKHTSILTGTAQQQPHPRRPHGVVPRQHDPHANRPVQPPRNRNTQHRWRSKRRSTKWHHRRCTATRAARSAAAQKYPSTSGMINSTRLRGDDILRKAWRPASGPTFPANTDYYGSMHCKLPSFFASHNQPLFFNHRLHAPQLLHHFRQSPELGECRHIEPGFIFKPPGPEQEQHKVYQCELLPNGMAILTSFALDPIIAVLDEPPSSLNYLFVHRGVVTEVARAPQHSISLPVHRPR